MVRSMTGFGKGKAASKGNRVDCDIKSVNHRFLEINVRMPKEYLFLENKIRQLVGEHLSRGRVDLFFSIDAPGASNLDVRLDEQLAGKYIRKIKQLQKKFDLLGELELRYLASLPGIVNVVETTGDVGSVEKLVLSAVEMALKRLVTMRTTEGRALKADVKARCRVLRTLVKKLSKQVPQVRAALQEKVSARVQELLGDHGPDPDRMAQEVAFLAMKSDVSEELTRLDTHIEQISLILDQGGNIGRKVDFLLQEANREITTCGNKVQGMEVSALVIEVKSELEKIREQIQNVE